jgi:hypothetical protein
MTLMQSWLLPRQTERTSIRVTSVCPAFSRLSCLLPSVLPSPSCLLPVLPSPETRVEAVVLPDEDVNPSRTHATIRIEKGPMKGQEFSVPLELLAEI